MHDGAVVVWSVLVVGVLFLEVVGHIRRHVLPVDLDVLVTIAPGLLVVEAQGMIELMLNDAVIHTALPVEGDHLLATSSAKRRVAPEGREIRAVRQYQSDLKLCCKTESRRYDCSHPSLFSILM